jgi:hypothetical protein
VKEDQDEEFPEFRPTRHELIALAKYYAESAIDMEYFIFLYRTYGCSDLRVRDFGWAQVGRIRRLLGEEVDTAIEEVYRTYGLKQEEQAWKIFLHGSEAERSALQEEIQRRMERSESRRDHDGG